MSSKNPYLEVIMSICRRGGNAEIQAAIQSEEKPCFSLTRTPSPRDAGVLVSSAVAAHKTTPDQTQSLVLTLVYKHCFSKFTSDH